MNFSEFESQKVNEAPNYSPERLKAHADKAETLRSEAMMKWKNLQKFLESKLKMSSQAIENGEEAYEDFQKAFEAYFDHLKTAP